MERDYYMIQYSEKDHEYISEALEKIGMSQSELLRKVGVAANYLTNAKKRGRISSLIYKRIKDIIADDNKVEGYGGKILDVPAEKDVVLTKQDAWEGKPFAERMKIVKEVPAEKAERERDNVFMWGDLKKWVTKMFWDGTETVTVAELAGEIKEIERYYTCE